MLMDHDFTDGSIESNMQKKNNNNTHRKLASISVYVYVQTPENEPNR